MNIANIHFVIAVDDLLATTTTTLSIK